MWGCRDSPLVGQGHLLTSPGPCVCSPTFLFCGNEELPGAVIRECRSRLQQARAGKPRWAQALGCDYPGVGGAGVGERIGA